MFEQEVSSSLSHFYVAFCGDLLVGYAGFWRVADEAHITSVTVHKSFRRRGYGRALMAHIEGVATGLGLEWATLEVRPSNKAGQRLYESLGYALTGRRKRYYKKTNEDALIMTKALTGGSSRKQDEESHAGA
jgi:ribosomal-protein-alanine N-acetyltransferase